MSTLVRSARFVRNAHASPASTCRRAQSKALPVFTLPLWQECIADHDWIALSRATDPDEAVRRTAAGFASAVSPHPAP